MPTLITNKRATFDYQVLETFQAGMSMSGKMVKQIRQNRINLNGKFIVWQHNRLEIIGIGNEEITENIPLLLKKKEVREIRGKISEKGISCIPLTIKSVGRWLKAEVALVKGKKQFDKREDIKKRDVNREIQRGLI